MLTRSLLIWIGLTPVFAFQAEDELWVLEDTGIYMPLAGDSVKFDPDLGFILLDIQDQRILHYSVDGEFIGTIGRQGMGPGEFNYPRSIQRFKDRLYIAEMGQYEVFDLKGNPIETITSRGIMKEAIRIENGWAEIIERGSNFEETPLSVILYDDQFNEEKTIATFPEESKRSNGDSLAQSFNPGQAMRFNPARGRTSLSADSTHRYLIFHPSYTTSVYIYDTNKLEEEPIEIEVEGKPYPFDKALGEKTIAMIKKTFERRGRQQEVVGDFPDYYPIIAGVEVLWDDTILVRKYPPRGEDFNDKASREKYLQLRKEHMLFYDLEGNQRAPQDAHYHHQRIVGMDENWVYVTIWNTDLEEATITRRPKDDFIEFLETTSSYEREEE